MLDVNNKSKALKNKLSALRSNADKPNNTIELALELKSNIGKTYIHTSTANKYILINVSNIYSTKDDFIPTAVYSSVSSDTVWSRPLLEFIDKFKLSN